MPYNSESDRLSSQPERRTASRRIAASDQHHCRTFSDDSRYLDCIPQEIQQQGAGCLELTQYLREGETVLHLGSGGGLVCCIGAQIVGEQGRILGIEDQEHLLALSRQYLPQFQAQTKHANVEFQHARYHDLRLDLERLDAWLRDHPARNSHDWLQAEILTESLRQQSPLIASDGIDVVIAQGVLNRTAAAVRPQLLAEVYRVLKRGGRMVLSELVSDEEVPASMRGDPALSESVRGAYREDLLVEAFAAAGFHGMEIVRRQVAANETLAGIEFRNVIVQAFKGKAGPCFERKQAVIYNGPWKAVIDDDGHTLYRGKRMAVCDKTFQLYSQTPYVDQITPIPPVQQVPLADARPFRCNVDSERDPRETKGRAATGAELTLLSDGGACGPTGCC